ncbi:Cocaine esterase [Lachnellula cervina]|uniref:Cocaine esterase n=1 Tax=Lachnellula cervina TaxID=1316786 RepID=A0A7D8ULV1_9HELO|nr:Cocaine esterase [Lachnellula cervina]
MEVHTRSLGAVYRKSVHPQEVLPPLKPASAPRFESRVLEGGKVVLEKDYAIPMRDGVTIYADVYRPVDAIAKKTPTIVFFAPFGKHGAVPREKFSNMGVDFSKLSKYAHWELPDPLLWCGEYGYSFISVDPRGTWWSEGTEANFFSPEEGRDGYDVVEWTAKQEWSTGKIGWGAVSYYAMSIYQTAVLKPPHLAAIMPWEGISDIYREVNTVGGIPNAAFQSLWMDITGMGLRESEDHAVASIEHPLYDDWWKSKVVDWSKIDIPAFSVTGWSSLGLHLRGTIAAWKEFSSKHKYLQIHGGREWEQFYKEENIQKQKLFWDRFLKDEPNEVDNWAVVEYDVRRTAGENARRQVLNFPPASNITTFSISDKTTLSTEPKKSTSEAAYVSYKAHKSDSHVLFDYKFASGAEITGYAAAELYIQAINYPDADLYVALQKIGTDGKEIKFYHSTQQVEASASFGWLRASHRELDSTKSVPERPVHLHERRQWIRPQDIVKVQVELWPSSTVWEAGETLRLVVKGSPFTNQEHPTQTKGPNHGFGEVRVWYGGQYPSALLLPLV